MKDKDKTKKQLLEESAEMQERINELEKNEKHRKQVEEKLRRSQKELRLMYDAITDLMTVISPDYRIVRANRVVMDQFGKDLIGKLCYEVYQARNEICPDCPTRKAIKTKKPAYSYQPATKISPPVDIYAFPILDKKGEVIAIVEHGKDITERKAVEEALQNSNSLLSSLIESPSDFIILSLAKDFKYTFFNTAHAKEMKKVWGVDIEKGKNLLDYIPTEEERERVLKNFERVLNGDQFTKEEAYGEGENRFWYELAYNPIYDKTNNVNGVTVFITNITKRRLAEESLQKLNEELEIRVKKRTADLTSTVKTLQREILERKRAQNQVEIYQGQLRTLISNLTTLEEKLKKRISEELHDNIGQCLALSKIKLSKLRKSDASFNIEIKEILELIDQTIRFTRSLSFELANPILYQMGLIPAIKWLSGEIKEKYGIDVDFESNDKLNKLNVETSVLLFKTINELLLNVVKHSKAKKAVVSLTSQGDNVQVKVEDNGIGFNASEINNYIIENNCLGIIKISEKIKYHGGTFDIKSRSGKGTVVTLIIPIH